MPWTRAGGSVVAATPGAVRGAVDVAPAREHQKVQWHAVSVRQAGRARSLSVREMEKGESEPLIRGGSVITVLSQDSGVILVRTLSMTRSCDAS